MGGGWSAVAAGFTVLFVTTGVNFAFGILFGATFFTTAPLSSTLVGQLFGPLHHGVIFGSATLFHHLAGAVGSYAGGLVFDLTGSYRPIFLASGILVTASAAVTVAGAPAPMRARRRISRGRRSPSA